MYIGGYGVKKDYGKALLYFASAAKQGARVLLLRARACVCACVCLSLRASARLRNRIRAALCTALFAACLDSVRSVATQRTALQLLYQL